MKVRLFLAALCIFLLPLCFADPDSGSSQFSAHASGYVITAGESTPCECEQGLEGYHPDCVCGESLTNPESNTASNLGSESLIILAALMLWLKFRVN